jgi:preprotein translocase subunit SecF
MQVIKENTHIDFLGKRVFFIVLSLVLNTAALYLWFATGDDKFGVDFRGGTEVVAQFNEGVTVSKVREAFKAGGFPEAVIQAFEGNDNQFSIRLSEDQSTPEGKAKVKGILQTVTPAGYTLLKEDFVGPVIGEQIRRNAIIALFLSLIAMQIYITARFDWRFAFGGIFALFHDVIITVGICLLMGKVLSAGILAALLTITGYSINDTIIVYDRVRENIAKYQKAAAKKKGQPTLSLMEIMNISVNETLSRTILTSMTAFFVVATLWLFGGGAVSDLSFSLMIGILIGTYSSIFIACPVVLACQKKGASSV